MVPTKLYYPFNYFYHEVCTVAFYGSANPVLVKGHLVLRTYYKDEEKTEVDIQHTSEYWRDELFFQTNKVLREQMEDGYTGPRQLIELSIPELGKHYRLIYNTIEEASPRYDDRLTILSYRDPEARGVAIILKRDDKGAVTWLDEKEARSIIERFHIS